MLEISMYRTAERMYPIVQHFKEPEYISTPHEEPKIQSHPDWISPLLPRLPTPILTTRTRIPTHNRPLHQPRHTTRNPQNPTNNHKPKQPKPPTRNKRIRIRIRLLPRRTPGLGHAFSPPFVLGFLRAEVRPCVEVV